MVKNLLLQQMNKKQEVQKVEKDKKIKEELFEMEENQKTMVELKAKSKIKAGH